MSPSLSRVVGEASRWPIIAPVQECPTAEWMRKAKSSTMELMGRQTRSPLGV